MAKSKRKKRKPGSGYQTPAVDPAALLLEIEEARAKLSVEKVGAEWGVVQRLLVKAGAVPSTVAARQVRPESDSLTRGSALWAISRRRPEC